MMRFGDGFLAVIRLHHSKGEAAMTGKFWECSTLQECNQFMACDGQENAAALWLRAQRMPHSQIREHVLLRANCEYRYAREIMGVMEKDQDYA